MTFGQYKLIKRLVKNISIFCIFAVFAHTLAVFSVYSIKAEDTYCTSSSISIKSDQNLTDINIYDSVSFSMVPINFPSTMQQYSAKIWYKTQFSSIPTSYGSPMNNLTGAQAGSINFLEMGSGTYEFYSTYLLNGCSGDKESNHLTVTITNNGIDSGSGGLSSEVNISGPNTGILENSLTYQLTVKGAPNSNVVLTVDDKFKFGSEEGATGHKIGSSGTLDESYGWDTSGTSAGNHTIKVKVFDPSTVNGVHPMSGYDDINVYLCSDSTTAEKCSTDHGGSSGSGADTGPAVTIPDKIVTGIGTFTLSRGSGIGGLLNMIVNFLLLIIGALAFISIMVAGIQYITAGGDSAKSEKAKKTIIYSVIAIVLVIFSAVIINLVNDIFNK